MEKRPAEFSRGLLMKGVIEHVKKLGFYSRLSEWVANEKCYTKEGYISIHSMAVLGRELNGEGQEGKWENI